MTLLASMCWRQWHLHQDAVDGRVGVECAMRASSASSASEASWRSSTERSPLSSQSFTLCRT